MSNIEIDDSELIRQKPKRMLEIEHIDNKKVVSINYSSLDILQTCPRKAKYYFIDSLRNTYTSPAVLFGSAVHEALEVWYCARLETRKSKSSDCRDAIKSIVSGSSPSAHGSCARCSSLYRFITTARESALPEDDTARSIANGIKILNTYFDTYLAEPYVVLFDDLGPICERLCEMTLYEDANLRINFFGTLDMVLIHNETKEIRLVDHKTTARLGRDFYNRTRPNFQYTGYVYLANEVLGIQTQDFTINGLQVAKTKTAFTREVTRITTEDIREFRNAVVYRVKAYLAQIESDYFPMSTPNACCMWGSCTFKRLCEETNPDIKKSIMEIEYESV